MIQRQDALASFIAYLVTEKRLSNNSVQAYESDLKHLDLFLKKKKRSLLKCDKLHLKLYLKQLHDRGLQSGSVSRKISTFKSFYCFAAKNFQVVDLGKGLIFPKLIKRLPKYLTEEETQQLLLMSKQDETPKGVRNYVMLLLLYASGMRISELLGLKFDQIIFTTGFIQIFGKGNKERLVPVPEAVLVALRHYLDHVLPTLCVVKSENTGVAHFSYKTILPITKHVFITRYQRKLIPLSRQSYWVYLKKLLRKAGIVKDISPHTLRHSLASHLLKNGADLRSLQMLLGHENLSTVQIYTHLQDDEQRKEYDKRHPRA
jgi:integrase/recombinase XerD